MSEKLSKKILKHQITQNIICRMVWIYIHLVKWTCKTEWEIDKKAEAFMQGEEKAVLAFWHGRLLMMPYGRPKTKEMHVLISDHTDGRIISQIINYFKINTITGSSSKGAIGAVKNMLKLLKSGENICITPDGPRGPFQQVADGVVVVPSKTGVAVVPSAFSASRAKTLSSWDRFMLPLPFGKLVYVVGEPYYMADKLDDTAKEQARLEIQQRLIDVTNLADKLAKE